MIGVFLDMSGPTLRYSRNGTDLGIAYGASEMGKAKTLWPFCLLARNMKSLWLFLGFCLFAKEWLVTFNFGASPFKYVPHHYWPLHTPLDDKQVQALSALFHKFRKATKHLCPNLLSPSFRL